MATWSDRVFSDEERDLIRSLGFDPENVEPGSLVMKRETWDWQGKSGIPPQVGFVTRGTDGVRRVVSLVPVPETSDTFPW